MEAAINAIGTELGRRDKKNRTPNVLASVEQWTQGLREELNMKIEKIKLGLHAVMTSLDIGTKKLREEFDAGTQATLSDMQTIKILVQTTCHVLETRLAEVEARPDHGLCGSTGTVVWTGKPPKFDGSTSWVVFRRLEALEQYKWEQREKATYLLAALQSRAAEALHGVHTGETYEERIEALESRYGDNNLVAAYCSRLKARNQLASESLQEFPSAIQQMTHRALAGLPEHYVHKEADHVFIDGIRENINRKLLTRSERTSSEVLSQTLEQKGRVWQQIVRQDQDLKNTVMGLDRARNQE
jgi:BMFP domain-containing protein YqiC